MKNDHTIELFKKPLILGASISAGYGTRDGGIGAVLARMINPEAKITNKAVSGASSIQSTSHLDFSRFDPSIVLGFDLFFWDAVRGQIGPKFEAHTRKIFRTFHERNVPMIIGKLPLVDLPVGGHIVQIKKNAVKVNNLLEKLAEEHTNALLYDPLACFMTMEEEHFSDGLHLTSKGNEYCAKYFLHSNFQP